MIERGEKGFCRVRENHDGVLVLRSYGRIVTAHVDTIEKKPVYHYRPGSKLLSIGTVGCSWSCSFCINSHISQADEIVGQNLSPKEIVHLAKQYGCQGIAYTYNEPLVFIEFARDIGVLAHQEGLFNVIVSNGYGTPEVLDVLSEFADCVTIGLKASASRSFLKTDVGLKSPRPIFETMLALYSRTRMHLEISNVVFDKSDNSLKQTRNLCRWICRRIGPDTPVHFVKFYPSYRMEEAPPGSSDILEAHHDIARETGLRHLYVANFPGHKWENTLCPGCGKVVIGRVGYAIQAWDLDSRNRCRNCGQSIPISGNLTETPPEERYMPVVFPPMDMLYVCEGLAG